MGEVLADAVPVLSGRRVEGVLQMQTLSLVSEREHNAVTELLHCLGDAPREGQSKKRRMRRLTTRSSNLFSRFALALVECSRLSLIAVSTWPIADSVRANLLSYVCKLGRTRVSLQLQ